MHLVLYQRLRGVQVERTTMKIYYLYAYCTSQLLYMTHDEEQHEKVRKFYESNGVMTYTIDESMMINNVKIDQKEWLKAQHD